MEGQIGILQKRLDLEMQQLREKENLQIKTSIKKIVRKRRNQADITKSDNSSNVLYWYLQALKWLQPSYASLLLL